MSQASEAIASLDPEKWSKTTAAERLAILKQLQANLYASQNELATSDANMKNPRCEKDSFVPQGCLAITIAPMANMIQGAIDLYESLAGKKTFEPGKITKVGDNNQDLYDVQVSPLSLKETVFYGTRSDRLRIQGKPVRVGPYDKKTHVVAVLGAGNYSSACEVIKAIFYNNCVVAHKPHPINAETDLLWASLVMSPLVDAGALAFCAADQGPALTSHPHVDEIYFTGGADTAQAIRKASPQKKVIAECGGVNPVIIVPGDRTWTAKEIHHHAQQLVTAAKMNGGAVCARPQVVVTSKDWSQRDDFLDALQEAVENLTPSVGTYYPGANEKFERFVKEHPNGKRLQPESKQDFLLIMGDTPSSYACSNEAFCQVLTEIPLESKFDASEFLTTAVQFCNTQLPGSLTAYIVIDETTRKNHTESLEQAVTDLNYGAVGINQWAGMAFFSPYLYWGGRDAEGELVSGNGDFGNVFGFEHVQKTIIDDAFVSPGQIKILNKSAGLKTMSAMANYSAYPSWYNLFSFLFTAITGSFKGKDW